MQPLIEFDAVSKRYRIGAGGRSLRAALTQLLRRLLGRSTTSPAELWALRDVSFRVEPGESVGILGHNGAGKTTVLKLLAGITLPTSGSIQVHGRLGSLIELGAGFHPEMTGRENVYLNGVILGMTRKEVARRFDSIIEFAEIGRFIDTPVKRYSSGMYVRLAFAVAAHIDPAVLLVDEVLAVGDIGFRAKCYRRMATLRESGTTILLVSHNVHAVRDVCDRALLLWQGELLEYGEPEPVIDAYLARMAAPDVGLVPGEPQTGRVAPRGERVAPSVEQAKITGVTFCDESGCPVRTIQTGRRLSIRVCYSAQETIHQPIVRVDFYRGGRLITGYSTAYDGASLVLGREGEVRLDIEGLHLPIGVYSISIVVSDTYEYNLLDVHHQAYPLQVLRAPDSRGEVALPHTWHHRSLSATDSEPI